MDIYMLTLEIVDDEDVQLAGAVVIAESATAATELIVRHLNEDWEEASAEKIGTAIAGSTPTIVAVDLS